MSNVCEPSGLAENILAVVITYNPPSGLERNLDALRAQVADVVVIDNGSADAGAIEALVLAKGCRFVGNSTNLGVAAALSQGAQMAVAEGFDWFASFDQDSLVSPGAFQDLMRVHAAHPERARIAVLAMSHRDRNSGRDYHNGADVRRITKDWREVRSTITSGSLTPVALFEKVGLFEDRLFIDAVDFEFCMRCRAHGYLVIESTTAVLEHTIGAATLHRFLWRTLPVHHHPPVRHYYITRNMLEICFRYFFRDFVWSAQNLMVLGIRSLMVLMYEDEKAVKIAEMSHGARDFALRRFGAHP